MNLSLRLLRHRESPGKDQSVQGRLPQCGSHVCREIMYRGRDRYISMKRFSHPHRFKMKKGNPHGLSFKMPKEMQF